MKIARLLILFSLLTSCATKNIDEQLLIGTWKNISLKVKMETFQNSDSAHWLVAKEGHWEEVLKIKPIETTYFPDGTFESIYTSLNGEPLGSENGKWRLLGDSLFLNSSNYNNGYKVERVDNQLRFISIVDWDQDGIKDDLYDGWQVKIIP